MRKNGSNLIPAIRIDKHQKLFIGKEGDSHCDIEHRFKIHTYNDSQRGFVEPGKDEFIGRIEACGWVERRNPWLWDYIRDQIDPSIGLHSRHLSPLTDISKKKILIEDKGLYLYLAERLSEEFDTVYYHLIDSSPYPESKTCKIGEGVRGVVVVNNVEDYLDEVDAIFYFDVYEGKRQQWLREKGYRIFGSGRSETIELDKTHFLDVLESVGLPVPPTKRIVGWYELAEYLKPRKNKYLKTPYYRGDFETKRYTHWKQFEKWWEGKAAKFGVARCKDIEVLVQDMIDAECEPGWDGLCVNGRYSEGGVGYEVKDKMVIFRNMECPECLDVVNRKMSKVYEELGFNGHCSTEVRLTKDGKGYFIDPTNRVPEPPGGLWNRMVSNYPHALWEVACGLVPKLEWEEEYGVEVILDCPGDIEEPEVCVEIDSANLMENINLKCYYKHEGAYYVNHKQSGGIVGNVAVWGRDLEKCWKEAGKIIEKGIVCDEMKWDKTAWEKAEEAMKSGEKFGIYF